MGEMMGRVLVACFYAMLGAAGACSGDRDAATVPAAPPPVGVAQPEAGSSAIPERAPQPELSPEAAATLDAIRAAAESGSQRELARLAARHDGFRSNFAGAADFDHWYMRRRMGSDPNVAVLAVLEEPFAERQIGDEVWYIWPDLSVLAPETLLSDRLSFLDRERVRRLLGEGGMQRLAEGEPWPGYRLAITQSGRWVYFLDGN